MSTCTAKNTIFEDETALIPGMIATVVWEEACRLRCLHDFGIGGIQFAQADIFHDVGRKNDGVLRNNADGTA